MKQLSDEQLDYCTDPDNCRRCKAHPANRGDMEHAGIGKRPDFLPAGERAELIRRLRTAGADGDAVHCWNLCAKAAALLEADAQRPALKPLTEDAAWAMAKQTCGAIYSETLSMDKRLIVALARAVIAEFCKINGLTGEAQPAKKVTCECGRVHKMTPYGHAWAEPAEQAKGQEAVARVASWVNGSSGRKYKIEVLNDVLESGDLLYTTPPTPAVPEKRYICKNIDHGPAIPCPDCQELPAPAVPEDIARDAARYRWLRDSPDSPIVSEAQATDKMVDRAMLSAAPKPAEEKINAPRPL